MNFTPDTGRLAGVPGEKPIAPIASMATVTRHALIMSLLLCIFAASRAAAAGTAPSAARPIANPTAARAVASASAAGTAAQADLAAVAVARQHDPGRQAAADQPDAEPLPPVRQPALDRADRPAQLPRRLLVREALEEAEHDRDAEALGSRPISSWSDRLQLARSRRDRSTSRGRSRPPSARVPPTGRGHACRPTRRGGPRRGATAPTSRRPERAAPAHQDQERGLERVLGVVLVAEDGPADPQDHRPVPLDQDREGQLGRLVAPRREALQSCASSSPPQAPTLKSVWSCRTPAPPRIAAMSRSSAGPFDRVSGL